MTEDSSIFCQVSNLHGSTSTLCMYMCSIHDPLMNQSLGRCSPGDQTLDELGVYTHTGPISWHRSERRSHRRHIFSVALMCCMHRGSLVTLWLPCLSGGCSVEIISWIGGSQVVRHSRTFGHPPPPLLLVQDVS